MQGKIIKGIAGFYYIYAENDEIYECKAKGIFRKDKQKPLVGDNVEIEVLDETIKVRVDYELDVNHEPLANCKIRMNIVSKGSGIAV